MIMTITGKKYVECSILGSGGGAEAEDSSYDSDYEADDISQSGKLSTATHTNVSRTSSDTLAAEFAEYVTVHGGLNSSTTTVQNPGYTARVEFALKLGYTERLVQAALQKLGPDPSQNELLAELIKLGASAAPRLAETPDETEALLPDSENYSSNLQQDSTLTEGNNNSGGLRPVVIDGSNVAMSHGNKEVFSCRGIKICVDWFRSRGHREITVFVPKWRKESSRPDNPIVDQEILGELERDRLLVFTPSRLVGGKRMVCYDDRYILRLAAELDGIVVSNDNYRDLAQESPEFRKVIEERILMYSFVNDRFMPPDDPLGRSGPTLDNFLKIGPKHNEPAPPCPYAKKCTYGNKCKFRHPERGPHPHKSVTERLVEHAQRHLQARGPSLSLPSSATSQQQQHTSLAKTKSWVPASASTFNKETQAVLKSRSVENVTVDSAMHATSVYTPISVSQNTQVYPSSLGWVATRVSNSESEPANMHRKLQRQLTLNPSCDPRLNQFQRYRQQQPLLVQTPRSSQAVTSPTHSVMQNRQSTRLTGNDQSYQHPRNWEQQHRQRQHHHQHVTRIASAPDSYRAWLPRTNNTSAAIQNAPLQQRLGASDPQLNLLAVQSSNLRALNWGNQQQQQQHQQQQQDARRRLHYHLANIFPEEQVQAAMALHPCETDPQKICATILTMFPKI